MTASAKTGHRRAECCDSAKFLRKKPAANPRQYWIVRMDSKSAAARRASSSLAAGTIKNQALSVVGLVDTSATFCKRFRSIASATEKSGASPHSDIAWFASKQTTLTLPTTYPAAALIRSRLGANGRLPLPLVSRAIPVISQTPQALATTARNSSMLNISDRPLKRDRRSALMYACLAQGGRPPHLRGSILRRSDRGIGAGLETFGAFRNPSAGSPLAMRRHNSMAFSRSVPRGTSGAPELRMS